MIAPGGVPYGTGTRGKSDYGPGGVFSLTPPSASGQPWTYTGVVAFTNAEGRDASDLLVNLTAARTTMPAIQGW